MKALPVRGQALLSSRLEEIVVITVKKFSVDILSTNVLVNISAEN